MGIYPDVEMLPTDARSAFESREDAVRQVAGFLWVRPGSEEEERLHAAADELLEEDGDGLRGQGREVQAERSRDLEAGTRMKDHRRVNWKSDFRRETW